MEGMRKTPMWSMLEAAVRGAPFMKEIALIIKKTIPKAKFRILEGQTQRVSSEVVAPVLVEFFSS